MTERRQGGTLCMQSGNPQSSLWHILVHSLLCTGDVTCTMCPWPCSPHIQALSHSSGVRACRDVVAAEVELVSKSQEGCLRIDLDHAMQLLQRREVEAHLGSRFGLHGTSPVSHHTAASPEIMR